MGHALELLTYGGGSELRDMAGLGQSSFLLGLRDDPSELVAARYTLWVLDGNLYLAAEVRVMRPATVNEETNLRNLASVIEFGRANLSRLG